MKNDIALLRDIVQIAQFLYWQNDRGDELAQELINEIHAEKYGFPSGVWPQVYDALDRLSQVCVANDEGVQVNQPTCEQCGGELDALGICKNMPYFG